MIDQYKYGQEDATADASRDDYICNFEFGL